MYYREGAEMKNGSYGQLARLFRLLSHPVRLRILDELRKRESCVCHLQAILNRPQPYISQQLRLLREAGVVEDDKDGINVYYRLADQRVRQLLEDTLGPPGEPTHLPTCTCPHCREVEAVQAPDDWMKIKS
jgi:DNA-binding transcriptional ArsR family regulator